MSSPVVCDDPSTASSSTPVMGTNSDVGVIGEVITVGAPPPPEDMKHRAVHQIKLSALQHNFDCVEAAASKQKCGVIVVVKADGYGHGAVESAIHLADSAGADAFAVATLEEGIALRRALDASDPKRKRQVPKSAHASVAKSLTPVTSMNTLFVPPPAAPSTAPTTPSSSFSGSVAATATAADIPVNRRAPFVRILVLGPPVGYPRCFDDYYFYQIECMVSGPEMASALLEWVANPSERKRVLVERAAEETKQSVTVENDAERNAPVQQHAATLSNLTGQNLAKEVRQMLLQPKKQPPPSILAHNGASSPHQSSGNQNGDGNAAPSSFAQVPGGKSSGFGGIEAAAKSSRSREKAAAQQVFVDDGTETGTVTMSISKSLRKLRFHALVDSGMGRLGFKTDYPLPNDSRRDTVVILQELLEAEINGGPVEFFGMCTHMAEANASSNYTNSQIVRFKSLLKRVRDAGIMIPTVSTDNSAALLTTTLTHFDPNEILAQAHANTRGYVRTGGAIYGQRPAFTQLQPISTLKAAVRHVAILKEGESVGYDRAYIAPYDVRIATLTIGFADGYPRELGNARGKVVIRDKLYPVAGNVCMDMMMVELGPATGNTDVAVGDVAILWGDPSGLVKLSDLASALKTTQSALTCGLNKTRVLREYV